MFHRQLAILVVLAFRSAPHLLWVVEALNRLRRIADSKFVNAVDFPFTDVAFYATRISLLPFGIVITNHKLAVGFCFFASRETIANVVVYVAAVYQNACLEIGLSDFKFFNLAHGLFLLFAACGSRLPDTGNITYLRFRVYPQNTKKRKINQVTKFSIEVAVAGFHQIVGFLPRLNENSRYGR